jgi:hypothetical protein
MESYLTLWSSGWLTIDDEESINNFLWLKGRLDRVSQSQSILDGRSRISSYDLGVQRNKRAQIPAVQE